LLQRCGKKRTWPFFSAASAGSASGFIRTNHCADRYGSMTVSERLHVAFE
jgi:hypothetical protein